ncbi:MAG TPA: hypothetical protein VFY79_13320 [Dehalococcoidia bacterium]|nr:hypothetical protein [Dehalococcoidia bacterium]
MRRIAALVIAAVLAGPAAGIGGALGVRAQTPKQAPVIVRLAYAGMDPLRHGYDFTAQIGNNSDDAITSGNVRIDLGYRWSMENADADGWTCATTADLTSSCTRATSGIQPHEVREFSILMGTAAGVCLTAAPEVAVVVHFPGGDRTASASAQAPADCSSPLEALPGTGSGNRSAANHPGVTIAAALAAFFAGGAAIGLSLARRACRAGW